VTLTAPAVTKTYDGGLTYTTVAGDLTSIGSVLVGGDTVTAATISYANKNVGAANKVVTLDAATINDGNGGANYAVTRAGNSTSTITARTVTLTAPAVTKTYDGGLTYTTVAGDLTSIGSVLVGGDTVTAATIAYTNRNAGTGNKTVTLSGSTINDGNGGLNYTITAQNGNATSTITALPITVTAVTNTKTYNGDTGAAAIPTITSGTLQGTDTATLTETYDTKNFGTGKTLTPAAAINDGNGGANYTVTLVTNTTGVINKAALTITAVANTKTYDGNTGALAVPTVTGLQGTDTVTGLAEVYSDKNAGSGKTLTVSTFTVNDGNGGNNYTVGTGNNTAGVITQAALTITAVANTKTYDGNTTAAAVPTITVGALQGTDSATFAETYSDKNAGSGKTLTPAATINDGNGGNNYTVTPVSIATGVINPKVVNLVAVRVFDTTTNFTVGVSQFAATVTGTVGTETLTVVSGTGTVPNPNVSAGTQTLTFSGVTPFVLGPGLNGGLAANYTFTGGTHTGTINASLVAVNLLASRVYDGTTNFVCSTLPCSFTYSITGTISNQTLIIASGTGTVPNKNVGTQTLNTVGLVLGDGPAGPNQGLASNYTLVGGNSTGTITPRTLAVTATGVNRVYDATTVATVTLGDNRVAGDVLTLSNTAASFADKNVGTAKAVSVTGISVTGTDAGNYTFNATAATTANITVRSVGINNVTANNKIYDALTAATLNTGTAALAGASGSTGLIAGDVVTLNSASATGSFANKNVGTSKAVTVSGFTVSGTDAANYSLVQPAGLTANITVRSVGINNVTANNRVYDGGTVATLNTGTAALAGASGSTGLVGGDVVTLSSAGATGAFADKNVGTGKAVTASGFTIGGTDATNYSLAQPAGLTANITARPITVTATTNTRTYDGTTGASALPTITSGSMVGGDTVQLAETYADRNAGTNKTIVPTATITDGNPAPGANYAVTLVNNTTGRIDPRPITVRAVTDIKTYDGTTTSAGLPTITVGALQTGDTTTTFVQTFNNASAGGGKTLTASGVVNDGNGGNNYAVTFQTVATGSITQAPLTIRADDKMMIVNTLVPPLTATVSGLVGGETLVGTPVLTTPGTSQSAIGSYSITVTGASQTALIGSNPNYALATPGSFVAGTLMIVLRTEADLTQNSAIASAVQSMGDLPPDAASSTLLSPGRRPFTPLEGDGSGRVSYNNLVSLAIRDGGLRLPVPPLERLERSNRR
jgi:hypothetical protein